MDRRLMSPRRRFLRRLHLRLMRLGVEFEFGKHLEAGTRFERHFSITINHHYFTFDIGLDLSHGVFRDELSTPHAELAAQREAWDAEDSTRQVTDDEHTRLIAQLTPEDRAELQTLINDLKTKREGGTHD